MKCFWINAGNRVSYYYGVKVSNKRVTLILVLSDYSRKLISHRNFETKRINVPKCFVFEKEIIFLTK